MFDFIRRLTIIGGIILLAAAHGPALARGELPGRFDHYVLSLSWSPSYCAAERERRNEAQCSGERPYAFIVHGLWPQYTHGWPEYCVSADRWVAEKTIDSVMDIMPSRGLIIHQWRRHGVCSALPQEQYFGLIRQLFGGLTVPEKYRAPVKDIVTSPEALKQDLLNANPGLDEAMVGVYCGNRRDRAHLVDVRICYSREGRPMSCTMDPRRQCRAKTLVLPAVRAHNPS